MRTKEAHAALAQLQEAGLIQRYNLVWLLRDTTPARWSIGVRLRGQWYYTSHATLALAIRWAQEFSCPTPALASGAELLQPGIYAWRPSQAVAVGPDGQPVFDEALEGRH